MILERDVFTRSIVLPVAFPGGLFDTDKCFDLRKADRPTTLYRRVSSKAGAAKITKIDLASYGLSFASRALLKSDEGSHDYGCASAAAANRRLAAANDGVVPEDKRRSYVGYFELEYRDIRSIRCAYYKVAFRYRPEDGSDAHFQLDLNEDVGAHHLPEGTASDRKKARQNDRLSVIAHLSARRRGPERHVCASDDDRRDMIEGLIIENYQPPPVA